MKITRTLTRRAFVGSVSAASCLSLANLSAKSKQNKIPIGLELYSVRGELKNDESGTLQRVAAMGFECVEFFSPYYEWNLDHAKEIKKQLDGLGLRCYSTHNSAESFTDEGIGKAIELNKILDTKYIVMASPGRELQSLDDWKKLAASLNHANEKMSSAGLHAGYHNHDAEWKAIDGQIPLETIASNTEKSIMLQLDVGTCMQAGGDPVKWIDDHPGRIRSLHLKEWSPQGGYKVLFGEGSVPWARLFAAAEDKGGVEYYLLEQEGSRFPEMETVERCLVAYRNLRTESESHKSSGT